MTFDLEPNFGQISKSKAVNNFFATKSCDVVASTQQHQTQSSSLVTVFLVFKTTSFSLFNLCLAYFLLIRQHCHFLSIISHLSSIKYAKTTTITGLTIGW